jgi:chemotaxis protein methyltransferase WspC
MADFEIEDLLQKVMGLKVTTIGKVTLDRSVQRRMSALSLDDKDAYVKKVQSSALELRELIEEVIIPETWFFRDQEPFKAMTQFLVTQWSPKYANKKLFRVLSSPCSTGEEPYSLTMTLLDSGWPSDKFTIHGVDISRRSIVRAKEGVYTKNSFRVTDSSYQSKHFKKDNKYYILNENIRDKVHFRTGNVLNRTFMEGLGLFDVIFFRNILIYFDELSRHQVISTLYKILADDGILFVGHAEANLFNNSPFTPAPYSQAFALYKKTKQKTKIETQKTISPNRSQIKHKTSLKRRPPTLHRKPPQKPPQKQPDLEVARECADKGELRKATEICEEYLDKCGSSAQAFFLLGIIRDADDDVNQAQKLFRKALYLDPNHEEALVFLSLLAEKTGNIKEAETLRQRIERLKNNTASHSSNG